MAQGDPWWLETYELERAQTDEMEKREEDNSWKQRLLPYLHDDDCKEGSVTTGEVLAKLGVDARFQSKQDQMRVAGLLTRLGWRRERTGRAEGRVYRYFPPVDWGSAMETAAREIPI